MASSFACRDDDLGYAVDLFVGHRRECVNGGVDRLAVSAVSGEGPGRRWTA
jgi:hypothetical protein